MNPFDINKVNGSEINTVNSQVSHGKDIDSKKVNKMENISKSGISKPTIELDDFFEFLDPKVVDKIMQTSEESRSRIVKNVHQYEFDINGAQNIIDSLG